MHKSIHSALSNVYASPIVSDVTEFAFFFYKMCYFFINISFSITGKRQ